MHLRLGAVTPGPGRSGRRPGNHWGDPSGPYDPSPADGLANSRGKGLTIADGIDDVPFTGGTAAPPVDAVQLAASVTPGAPLLAGAAVTVNASATYELVTAPTGEIVLYVLDQDGVTLKAARL